MKITPIGIYGSYPAPRGATSCYYAECENARLVLDLGCGALSHLLDVLDPALVDAFVITHLHYDHFCDLFPLSYYPGRHVVYCPSSPADRFTLIRNSHALDVRVIGEGAHVNIKGTELEFTRTAHGVETYAVRVSENGKSFVYTSDTAWFDGLADFCKGSRLVLADCSFGEGAPHMTPSDGLRLRKISGAEIVAAHIDPAGGLSRLDSSGIPAVKESETIALW